MTADFLPSPLPAGWRVLKVSDAGTVQLGRQRSPEHHAGPNMRQYLRVANVFEARIDAADVMEMNFTPQEYETYRLSVGDVLLNEGQSLELVGRAAIYKGEVPGACFTNSLVRFRPHAFLSSEFALLVFRHYLHAGVFQKIAKWTTNIAHLGAGRFAELPFVLPPPDVQAAIVQRVDEIESNIDAGVASLGRAAKNLKGYRAAILKAACEGRLVPTEADLALRERRSYEAADRLLARILEERRARWEREQLAKMKAKGPLPKDQRWTAKYKLPAPPVTDALPVLPEGWCWTSVETVGDVLLGRQRAPQYLTGKWPRPYLRVANVKDDALDLSDVEEMDFDSTHFEKYKLEAGDVLVSEGQSPHLVGQSAIYGGQIDGLCFQKTLHRFRAATPGPSAKFAQIVFRSHVKNGVFQRMASITTNIAHLTLEKFIAAPFPLPPAAEQERIVREVDRLLSFADDVERSIKANLRRGSELRRAVLRQAFNGGLLPPPSARPRTTRAENTEIHAAVVALAASP
jgi:type I restriction enzyme, S subunit